MLRYIIQDIMDAFHYIPYGIVIGGVACIVIYIVQHHKGRKNVSYLAIFLLVIYLSVLSHLVLFNRAAGSRNGLTLGLFGTIGNDTRMNSYVVENILLFVPFGVLTPPVWKKMRYIRFCIPISCLCSCGIELLQYITKRGHCQLDDMVMNVLGAFIGCVLFDVITKMRGVG